VAPIFGAAPLYIKKDKKWQMPLIMRPELDQMQQKFQTLNSLLNTTT
jgi:hypothetical protein